jgi:enoyl-CoA hydratase/carnithine racemase
MDAGGQPDPEELERQIIVGDEGKVRIVTFNRPHRINAFTATSYRRLANVLDEADAAGDVAVVLMEGAGRGFSSGVDLHEVGGEQGDLADAFDGLIRSLSGFSKPLLAAVHGAAVGFGTTMLLHCDVVLVAETARLRFPFAVLGTTPEAASSVLLPHVVGGQLAADLLLTGRWITGSEAAHMGLVARAYPERSLVAEARATARALAELPGPALAATKRLLRTGRAAVVRDALDRESAEARTLRDVLGPMGYKDERPS